MYSKRKKEKNTYLTALYRLYVRTGRASEVASIWRQAANQRRGPADPCGQAGCLGFDRASTESHSVACLTPYLGARSTVRSGYLRMPICRLALSSPASIPLFDQILHTLLYMHPPSYTRSAAQDTV
jgi:hypothetical protein